VFSKLSRYRKLPDEVTTDPRGRTLRSKSIRLLPEVSGDAMHVLAEGERLDYLAHKYYRQPRKWWRINDANPEFLSPLELVGDVPLVTTYFHLSSNGFYPRGYQKWWQLLQDLPEQTGVEQVRLEDDYIEIVWRSDNLELKDRIIQLKVEDELGTEVSPLPDSWHAALDARKVQKVNLSPQAVVLPQPSGWLLLDKAEPEAGSIDSGYEEKYLVLPSQRGGRYDFFPPIFRQHWTAVITYNRMNIDASGIAEIIGSYGFKAEIGDSIGRVGKQIVIPPDTAG
jgi:hypothetical protein